VCITEKPGEAPSLGSLVSLRAEALRISAPVALGGPEGPDDHHEQGRYDVTLRVLQGQAPRPGMASDDPAARPIGLVASVL